MRIRLKTTDLITVVLGFSFAYSAIAQVSTPLRIVDETNFPQDIFEIVAVGGLNKQIRCDAEANVWIPGIRGYSSTLSSLVRFGPKNATLHIDIDEDERLKNGSIEFFSPLNNGGVLALVRKVTKYNAFQGSPTTPKRYGNTYSVTFGPSGAISSLVKLKLPSFLKRATALARLKNGWLVAGYTEGPNFLEVHAFLFDMGGKFKKEILLPANRARPTTTGTAGSIAVFRPTAMTMPNGDVLVFRGISNQPIYRFSQAGQLLSSAKLLPDGIDFWSPSVIGDSLFVSTELPPEKVGDFGEGPLGPIPVVRWRSAFPIFDLKSGHITEVLTWTDNRGTVGCFNGARLMVFTESFDGWKILTLERIPAKQLPGS